MKPDKYYAVWDTERNMYLRKLISDANGNHYHMIIFVNDLEWMKRTWSAPYYEIRQIEFKAIK